MTDYILIGKKIRASREKLRMSQNELAELSGLSNTYISRIERAKKQISLDALMRVSAALSVSVNDLVYQSGAAPGIACDNSMSALLSDCTDNEKHFIYSQIALLKEGISNYK